MNDSLLEKAFMVFVAIFLAAILFADLKLQQDCQHGGGHYVRGMFEMECVK